MAEILSFYGLWWLEHAFWQFHRIASSNNPTYHLCCQKHQWQARLLHLDCNSSHPHITTFETVECHLWRWHWFFFSSCTINQEVVASSERPERCLWIQSVHDGYRRDSSIRDRDDWVTQVGSVMSCVKSRFSMPDLSSSPRRLQDSRLQLISPIIITCFPLDVAASTMLIILDKLLMSELGGR